MVEVKSKTDIRVIAIPYFSSVEDFGACPPSQNSNAVETPNPYYFVYGPGAGSSTSESNSALPLASLPDNIWGDDGTSMTTVSLAGDSSLFNPQDDENAKDLTAGIDDPSASSLENNNFIASSDDPLISLDDGSLNTVFDPMDLSFVNADAQDPLYDTGDQASLFAPTDTSLFSRTLGSRLNH